jgi:hypothetical protein
MIDHSHSSTKSRTSILLRDYLLFIVVNVLGETGGVVAFKQNCSGAMAEKWNLEVIHNIYKQTADNNWTYRRLSIEMMNVRHEADKYKPSDLCGLAQQVVVHRFHSFPLTNRSLIIALRQPADDKQ